MSVFSSPFNEPFRNPFGSPFNGPGIGGGGAWSPLQYFAASEQGIWLDPSDFTRYMGEKGPELILDPGFDDTTKWTKTPSWSVSGGVATHNGTAADYIYTATEAPVVGKWYELTVVVTAVIGAISIYCGQTPAAVTVTTTGTHKIAVQCPGTGLKFSLRCSNAGGGNTTVTSFSAKELTAINTATMFQDSAGTTPVTAVEQPVGKILDKSGRGNHATQATTAQKPVLSARVNGLLASEDFSAATWIKNSVTVVANSATASDGNVTADKLVPAAANLAHQVYANASGITVVAGQRWTGSVDLKADGCGFCYVEFYGGVAKGFCVNLATGAITNASAGLIAVTVEDLGDGWWRANVTDDTTAATAYLQLYPRATAGGAAAWLGDGVNGVLMSRAQLTQSATPTHYQRVNTNTDYDTAGFPHYAKLDRVDDNITAAAGGGGTTGIIICAAIRASGAGNARTIWSDRGTNTGYRLSINASNQLVLSAGNGTAHTEVIGPTITADTDYVVTGWHDGVNLNVQVNSGSATSAAFGTAAAGTAGFTIGKDNGAATGYYGDRIYEIVYRKDDTSSAGDRTSLITYMAEQAGITL